MDKGALGQLGEASAEKYLRKKKYRILARNLRSGHQETDILAENKEFLVFCEVKSRTFRAESAARFGRPAAAVDADKQRHLLTAARVYLATHPTKKRVRFDVVEVYFSEKEPPQLLSITHIEGAFGAR